jgi:hypothetical protein
MSVYIVAYNYEIILAAAAELLLEYVRAYAVVFKINTPFSDTAVRRRQPLGITRHYSQLVQSFEET